MAEPVINEISGLQLSNNTFSASAPGSLLVADNVVISQKGVAEPRNGQLWIANTPAANKLPFQLTEFQSQILVNYGTSKTDTSMGLGYVNGSSITAYSGTYNPVDDDGVSTSYGRMKFAQAAQYLHFCTQAGPKVLEAYNGTPRISGLSRMPNMFAQMRSTSVVANGWMPYNSSVAYRSVLRHPTSSGVSLLSPPSSRYDLTNRLMVPIGGLVRTGGTTVTATLTPDFNPGLAVGDTFTLSPGETNFVAGTYTVTGTSGPAGNVFTYASAGSNVSSTVAQDANTGSRAPFVTVYLPLAAKAGDALRVYRSVATSVSTTEPSDELYLCNEIYLDAPTVANGFTQFTDNTPQAVLSDPLYSDPQNGEGADEINFQPPIYRDVANWNGQTYYANTTGQHALTIQMLGVGAPNGVQNNDTITIADGVHTTTFTFKTTPVGSNDIAIISDGTPSYNIAMTTQRLLQSMADQFVGFINTGIGGYGNTSQNGFPGSILLERTDWGPQFNVKVSRPASWTPALSASTATNSDNNHQPNGLALSKVNQPESVPVINYTNVGSKNYDIARVFGLRNALIVCKEGDGIYAMYTSGLVQQISVANIIAPDCAAVFADNLWVYTDQGILRISDTGGATVVSRPIETDLISLATQFPTTTYAWSFAVPYETERRIMFYVPVGTSPTNANLPRLQAYCYSQATNAWTKFNYEAISGVVSTSHHLWTGAFDERYATSFITEEAKTDTYLDKGDLGITTSITAINVGGNPLLVTLATAPGAGQGDGIEQGSYRTKIAATRFDVGANVFQLAEPMPFTVAACKLYFHYPVEIQFLPSGNAITRKSISRLATVYKPEQFANYYGQITLETDRIQAKLAMPIPSLGFGGNGFGVGSFGDPTPLVVNTNPVNGSAPAAQFFPGLLFNEVWLKLKLQAMALTFETSDAPANRGK